MLKPNPLRNDGASDEPAYTEVNDSGKREEHSSGAVRDTREGKGRFDLISPIALKRLAVHMENGAKKYGDRNWEKGLPVMRFLDSAIRHIYEYIEGDRSEDHLSAAVWNCQGAIHTEEMVRRGLLPAELNDVPKSILRRWARNPIIDEALALAKETEKEIDDAVS